ncbi:hypothetical protein PMAYCL1PPCAC_15284 [Pristionchus mayeri]|uniref:Uncharacterized protein n=1 Tax=Pristionchus mayeri TaxID=1317129 RepID=A0AAN5HXT3_9BILA|nr:hypothetical protein PMAYCL1PPCAC_15284 [Pristionchus mayeri]
MNSQSLLLFSLLGLLVVSSIDAAKAKGKREKAIVQTVEVPVMGEAVVLEEPSVIGEVPAPKIYRPKMFKVVTAYDQCKQECKKIRDQQDLHAYAAQLREELAAAEAALGEAPAEETQSAPVV